MPSSKRPSRAAMDDDAAAADGLHPSSPRSKKRSSRSKARSGDRRSPNPNPRRRADYHGSEPSRKSERKRKPRSFPDSAPLALAVAAPASSSVGGHGAAQKLWTEADEVALLNGAISFRARNGGPPRLPDMGALFESIRNSLSPHLDQAKMYYKLKRLKSKFFNSAPAGTSNPHELLVRGLSADLWDTELAPPVEDDVVAEEEEDPEEGYTGADVVGAASLPLVSGLLGEYWRRNGSALSGVSLEKGLALLGAEEGRVAEAKWRRQLDAEMRTQVRRHDLAKEVFGLLIDAVKGLGP
ncbi:STOREKEEPER protein [Brachypodium distachyon]|uniref:Glabrous enhancer-binding protein-like DBD domain-containing protein n=1 Tax=Brachypodium distachyon TaxID=15368 RepID=I1GZW5_BRADI|nr:STOREKEEPER protein [Brachypodium distachyon]KQK19050.1 hypothetical protein BRADI_1g46160v3 [Brachypodium distachyon]|eukprot:XP_003564112.1 STOREKEEPER protein [Brachypodium distachyon]